ncbi:hypothetical protein QBC36DRAFT_360562 [Triangularia setosa]|uniref:Heterokaryon incompatibility domain-containing protein n=1 Tax=Triangularia setosa TaxID=2587417 RepID=A0AAN7AAY3_9PEZI|nr:hypothetical protein QBC36DRAFT_360562 [Podospora setosa]
MFLGVVTSSAMKSDGYPDNQSLPSPDTSQNLRSVMRSGFIARVGSNCVYKGRALSIKHVNSDKADFEQIKGWITTCNGSHSDAACNPTQVQLIPPFSAHPLRDEGYYPQGHRTAAIHRIELHMGCPFKMTSQNPDSLNSLRLEAVVEDAINVTLSLGCVYLWVDRYCVDQKPGPVKNEQPRHMNFVYHDAEVMIIGAAGEGASFGSPSVGQRLRKHQPAMNEGLLSRRHLFFTQYEVSFECNGLLAREAIAVVNSAEDDLGVHQRLSGYTPRQLTYELDALNAMLGVFQLYSSLPQPAYHLCSILIVPQTYTYVENQHVDIDPGTERSKLAGFVSGLLSTPQPGRRHPDFPSRSWTGWRMASDHLLVAEQQPSGLWERAGVVEMGEIGY